MSLLKRRGELLEKAQKKVADDGYVFKKGCSHSKVYGEPDSPSKPKRPKYDEEAREGCIEAIEEELKDISQLLVYKEKSIFQTESAQIYKLCEKLRSRTIRNSRESESSDIDSGPMSSMTNSFKSTRNNANKSCDSGKQRLAGNVYTSLFRGVFERLHHGT